ncbi:MAG: hypothetical protein R2748_22260 [Bryobacterales bacterium]
MCNIECEKPEDRFVSIEVKWAVLRENLGVERSASNVVIEGKKKIALVVIVSKRCGEGRCGEDEGREERDPCEYDSENTPPQNFAPQ